MKYFFKYSFINKRKPLLHLGSLSSFSFLSSFSADLICNVYSSFWPLYISLFGVWITTFSCIVIVSELLVTMLAIYVTLCLPHSPRGVGTETVWEGSGCVEYRSHRLHPPLWLSSLLRWKWCQPLCTDSQRCDVKLIKVCCMKCIGSSYK